MYMLRDQTEALEDVLARRPRGLKTGDAVEYYEGSDLRQYWVMAIQQWMTKGVPHAVGLVWVSRCPVCGSRWHQVTETRPKALARVCDKCDVVGIKGPSLDLRVAEELVKETDVCRHATSGVRRRGRIEMAVIERLAVEAKEGTLSLHIDEVIRLVSAGLPGPEDGKRDTRPQHIRRAVQNLSKEKEPLLALADNHVVIVG